MGTVIVAEEDDWTAVIGQKWTRLTRVLIRDGADAGTLGQIYLVVVQLALLFRSETWVLTPLIKRLLGGFHHRVACILTNQKGRKGQDGGWVYPHLEYAMTEAVLQEVDDYLYCCQNILRLGPLCTSVWRQSGGQVQDWQYGGGNMRVCI